MKTENNSKITIVQNLVVHIIDLIYWLSGAEYILLFTSSYLKLAIFSGP